jgi:hypothetical protein
VIWVERYVYENDPKTSFPQVFPNLGLNRGNNLDTEVDMWEEILILGDWIMRAVTPSEGIIRAFIKRHIDLFEAPGMPIQDVVNFDDKDWVYGVIDSIKRKQEKQAL